MYTYMYVSGCMVLYSPFVVSPSQPGTSSLLDASRDGDLGTVRKLVSAGVNVDLQTQVQYVHVEVHMLRVKRAISLHAEVECAQLYFNVQQYFF